MLTLLWAATLSAATLWTGEEAISWSGGGSVQVSAAAFADAQVGDELRLNFIFTGQTDWPQVSLRNGNWADLTHAGNILISAADDHVSYYLTTGMLEDLQQHGMVLSGISPDGHIVETMELRNGGYFVGVQFHPEFKSRPNRPHPLFCGLVSSALERKARRVKGVSENGR